MRFRLLLLALGTFAIGTDGFVIAGILPSIAHDLSISLALAGFLVTAFSIAYAIGSPVLAALTGSIARKRLLLLALSVFILANVLAAVANSFLLLIIARMIAALSAALYTPSALTVAALLAPKERRGQALSLVTAGLTIATVVGIPLGILISTQLSWRGTLLLVALLGMIAFIGILTLFPSVANPPAMSLSKKLAPLRQPAILITFVNLMVWVIGGFTVYTYLSSFLEHLTHLEGASISVMFLLFGAAGVIGNMIGGYGADHWGAVRTMVSGLPVLAAAYFALPLVSGSFWGMACVVVVWGMAGWVLLPPLQHRLITLAPKAIDVVLSLNGSVQYLGVGIGAAVGALVVQYFSLSALGWVGGTFELLALIILTLSAWLFRSAPPSLATNLASSGQASPAQISESLSFGGKSEHVPLPIALAGAGNSIHSPSISPGRRAIPISKREGSSRIQSARVRLVPLGQAHPLHADWYA
jgi:predicted MFS family arabinose efflux permease